MIPCIIGIGAKRGILLVRCRPGWAVRNLRSKSENGKGRDRRWRRHWLPLGLLPVAACTATSSVDHRPAELAVVETTKFVAAPPDVVWQRWTERLPEAGFTMVEVDDSSRVAKVSLTTDRPDMYIDCGSTRRTFEGPLGGAEVFDYDPAASASYKLTNYQGAALEADRSVALDATAVVMVEPRQSATDAKVQIDYVLNTEVTYRDLGIFGASGDGTTVTRAVEFHSTDPGSGDEEVAVCASNGHLESKILALVE